MFKGLSLNKFFLEGESLTLKNKIYKYMASISENVYVDKLHDIVNEYNNINNRAI